MKLVFQISLLLVLASSCNKYIYVVRHAEKANPNLAGIKLNDPSLSDSGRQRATRLLGLLKEKKIRYVFATNTLRAMETADPTAQYFNLTPSAYPGMPDSNFISQVKRLKGNILIVGHSNTVDDIVNKLCDKKLLADLAETEFDNFYVVQKKKRAYVLTLLKY